MFGRPTMVGYQRIKKLPIFKAVVREISLIQFPDPITCQFLQIDSISLEDIYFGTLDMRFIF